MRTFPGRSPRLAAAFCLFLCFLTFAGAQEKANEKAENRGSRYSQVFDRSADQGKLVARFLRIHTVGSPPDKAGDSTILTSPEGLVMLIDAGEPSCSSQIVAHLKAMGITRLDFILISHPHIDHLGGLPALLDAFPVGKVLMSRLEYPSKPSLAALAAIEGHGVPIEYLAEGSTFAFGRQVTARVLNPGADIKYYKGYPANGTTFINGKSLVVRFSYCKASMLFMGDLYKSGEKDLIAKYGDALRSDIIKVGHHGYETSSDKSFIKAVSPKMAFIINDWLESVKIYNEYRKAGARVFVTFLDGCVRLAGEADGTYTVLTEKDRDSDFLK